MAQHSKDFKAVLVSGFDTANMFDFNGYYTKPDHLNYNLTGLPDKEFLSSIQEASISASPTSFNAIFMHGSLNEYGQHTLCYNLENCEFSADLIRALNPTSEPRVTEVYSCYSGNSYSLPKYLSNEEIVITSSLEDSISFDMISNEVSSDSYSKHSVTTNPYEKFLLTLPTRAGSAAKFITGGKFFELKPGLKVISDYATAENFLKDSVEKFIEFSNGQTWLSEPVKLNADDYQFSSEEVKKFAALYALNYLALSGQPWDQTHLDEIMRFLKDPENHTDDLKETINSEIVTHFSGNLILHPEKFDLLLESGLDPNIKGNDDMPIIIAALITGGYKQIESLLKAGADPNVTYKGFSTIFYAYVHDESDKILDLLQEYNIQPSRDSWVGWIAENFISFSLGSKEYSDDDKEIQSTNNDESFVDWLFGPDEDDEDDDDEPDFIDWLFGPDEADSSEKTSNEVAGNDEQIIGEEI